MKVLIVAKTRRGGGACIGGITEQGQSVRLIAADPSNPHAGLEYEVGDVWDLEYVPEHPIVPPHVENVIVLSARRVKRSSDLEKAILRFMPPITGGPEKLFDGLVQATPTGGLYIGKGTGLPRCSTMFWIPDQPLQLDCEGKRIRYRYPTSDGGRALTFVGFQEPVTEIPAGALLRVSLAHWWRPDDKPEEELRCFAQLSGWIVSRSQNFKSPVITASPAPPGGSQQQSRPTLEAPKTMPRAREILKQTFGFSDFLPLQAEVIQRVLQRGDTLVVMPTGGGKSLCYQLPALLFEGLTVVVSPLIALMQDQVSQLLQLDVRAAFLNSTLSLPEYTSIASRVRHGQVKILYAAPETLLRPETLLLLEQSRLACLAVDEAHCISEWGHDFRPEYRQLQPLRRRFPQAVCLALTATATLRVREDIQRLLRIPAEGTFVASFNRRNLFLSVQPRNDGLAQVLDFLEKHRDQSGIIYCGTRKQTEELATALNANGWSALPYHAGLDDEVRRQNQERFIRDDVPLMVATIAFGMGINKSNVRFIVHYNLPKNLENYYQEIGRAGRDGLPADCLLLHSRADARLHRHFIDQGAVSEQPGRRARLDAIMRYAEARDCRRIPLLAYFGENLGAACGQCDNCLEGQATVKTSDATIAAQKFLSCVKRTGERFGPAHIIAVLRGSQGERVLARRHDRLSTYGIGKEHSTEEWRTLAQQFIHLGLLEQDLQFGGLSLTPKGWEVLKGKEKVLVPAEDLPAARLAESPAGHAPELFQRLRALRKELAFQANVPAYVIFSDRVLLDMAAAFPQNKAELLAINGVGQAKLASYGNYFLKVIRDYCQPRGLPPKHPVAPAPPREIIRPEQRRRFHEIGELFAAGQTIEAIRRRYGTTAGTVLVNLEKFHASGGQIDAQRLLALSGLTESERARALAAFQRLGLERLGPIHDALGGAIDYEELHLLRLYVRCSNQKKLD